MTDWTEKYRPTSLNAVKGNESSLADLREWADNWDDHKQAVILHGVPGIGKTTAAHALANDMEWEAMEMNASEERTGDIINRIAGEASKTGTLTAAGTSGRRLVILDEADNLHRHKDRGGNRAMTDVVKNASQPIALIANNFYDMSDGLRNACKDIEFSQVKSGLIIGHLAYICNAENVSYEKEALKFIADKSDGDVRAAVNDLQSVGTTMDKVTTDGVASGNRDRGINIFEYLDNLFKESTTQEVSRMSRDLDETPDELIMWVEDNAPKVYNTDELTEAYDHLSRADRWLNRVVTNDMDFTYWKYASTNMTSGVAAARSRQHGGWTRFGPPWGRYYGGGSKHRTNVAKKVALHSGVSTATAKREILPVLSAMTAYCKPRELTVAIAALYELDEKEVSAITGSGATTNKVQGIVEDSKEKREQFDLNTGHDDTDDQGLTGLDKHTEDKSEPVEEDTIEEPTDTTDEESESSEEEDEDGGPAQTGLSDFL